MKITLWENQPFSQEKDALAFLGQMTDVCISDRLVYRRMRHRPRGAFMIKMV